MQTALWVSKTGMTAQDAKMTAISNNLANINTVGFKRDRMIFEDLFYSIHAQAGTSVDGDNNLPTGVQLGNGVRVVGTQKVHTQGGVQDTHQELDLAIVGAVFFQVENSDGEIMFSRNGQFNINEDGQIVNTAGLPLVPEITIPEGTTSVVIDVEGGVSVATAGETQMNNVGNITLVTFMNPAGLSANGGNLYRETEASGTPNEVTAGLDGAGTIKQGALEGSNVQVVTEMVDMIATQRAYEMSAKMVSAADEMLRYIAQAT